MSLIFKKATESDIPSIVELTNKIWRIHYPSIISAEQIDYMLERMYASESIQQQMNEGHKFTIVYIDEKAVGYAAMSKKEGRCFLHKFYIDTDIHRNGIGKALYENLISTIDSTESVELTVNRQNFKAINFYFKMGFTIDRIADFDIGKDYFMNDFVMIRKVKKSTIF